MSGCERYLDVLEEYIDGLLDETRKSEFLNHLDGCPSCRAEYKAERALVESMQALDVIDPGDEFTSMVLGRIFAPEAVRLNILQRAYRAIESTVISHRRLAWSTFLTISILSAFFIPYLLKTGALSALTTGSDVISFLVKPLAGLITSLDRMMDFAGPLFKAIYLVIKAFAGFLFTLVGTQQISFVLIGSVLIVMVASLWTFFHVALAKRRLYNAELRI
jgi:hypothetical protein